MAGEQRCSCLLRRFPLQEAHLLRHLLDLNLVALADQRKVFAVTLFQCREQRAAETTHYTAQFQRLLNQQHAAHRANRLIQPADDAADINPCCRCLDQHAGVNRWIEQSERANHACYIHTMANLEEPVGAGVPVAQQLVVARNAEVECAPDSKKRAGIPSGATACPLGGEIEWELTFQVHQRVTDWSETLLLELREGPGFYC